MGYKLLLLYDKPKPLEIEAGVKDMPRKRNLVDPVIAEEKEFEKWLLDGERASRADKAATKAELRSNFAKQFRKMKADCEGQIRRKKGEILQYKEREGGEARHQKDIAEVAKARLNELQAELAVLIETYTLSKRLMKAEFLKEIHAMEA